MSLSIKLGPEGPKLEYWIFEGNERTRWDYIDIDMERAKEFAHAIEDAMGKQGSGVVATHDTKFEVTRKHLGNYRIEWNETVRGVQIERGSALFEWSVYLSAQQLLELYQELKSLAS